MNLFLPAVTLIIFVLGVTFVALLFFTQSPFPSSPLVTPRPAGIDARFSAGEAYEGNLRYSWTPDGIVTDGNGNITSWVDDIAGMTMSSSGAVNKPTVSSNTLPSGAALIEIGGPTHKQFDTGGGIYLHDTDEESTIVMVFRVQPDQADPGNPSAFLPQIGFEENNIFFEYGITGEGARATFLGLTQSISSSYIVDRTSVDQFIWVAFRHRSNNHDGLHTAVYGDSWSGAGSVNTTGYSSRTNTATSITPKFGAAPPYSDSELVLELVMVNIYSSTTFYVTSVSINRNTLYDHYRTQLMIAPDAPSLSGTPTSSIVNGQVYSFSMTNAGGSATFSISPDLPGGLSLDTATGDISGTSTEESAVDTYTITATNVTGSDTLQFSLQVDPAAPSIDYSSYTSDRVYVGITLPSKLANNTGGTTTTYSISPDLAATTGLTFNTTTGEIAGTPTTLIETTTYTVTATNVTGSDTHTIDFEVSPNPTLTYSDVSALDGTTLSIIPALTFVDPTAGSFDWVDEEGNSISAPDGLTVDTTTGVITGTMTSSIAGTYRIKAEVQEESLNVFDTFALTLRAGQTSSGSSPWSVAYTPNTQLVFVEGKEIVYDPTFTSAEDESTKTTEEMTETYPDITFQISSTQSGLTVDTNGQIAWVPDGPVYPFIATLTIQLNQSTQINAALLVVGRGTLIYESNNRLSFQPGQTFSIPPSTTTDSVNYSIESASFDTVTVNAQSGVLSGTAPTNDAEVTVVATRSDNRQYQADLSMAIETGLSPTIIGIIAAVVGVVVIVVAIVLYRKNK